MILNFLALPFPELRHQIDLKQELNMKRVIPWSNVCATAFNKFSDVFFGPENVFPISRGFFGCFMRNSSPL